MLMAVIAHDHRCSSHFNQLLDKVFAAMVWPEFHVTTEGFRVFEYSVNQGQSFLVFEDEAPCWRCRS
jgi:hypothetical protein